MTIYKTRYLMPSLAPLYSTLEPYSWLLIRVVAGGFLLVHGYNKLVGPGFSGETAYMAKLGAEPAMIMAAFVMLIETIGAICIAIGLFTRFFAAAAVIEFLVIIAAVHGKNGFGWTSAGGGWEYPLFWLLALVAILIRGGGPLSVDQRLGYEL
jgi:putative oxidoreductase